MGDIADGLINGDFDFFTGEYLGQGYGYPRSRADKMEKKLQDTRKKEYWKSLPDHTKEIIILYNEVKGRSMAQVRMRDIGQFIQKELNILMLPKSEEQYKLVYENIEKFKEYLTK